MLELLLGFLVFGLLALALEQREEGAENSKIYLYEEPLPEGFDESVYVYSLEPEDDPKLNEELFLPALSNQITKSLSEHLS